MNSVNLEEQDILCGAKQMITIKALRNNVGRYGLQPFTLTQSCCSEA